MLQAEGVGQVPSHSKQTGNWENKDYMLQCSWQCQSWTLGMVLAFGISGAIASLPDCASAQVNADNTLRTIVTNNGSTFEITGGMLVDGSAIGGTKNLFHSFSSFSIPRGRIADFLNDTSINNILARVTGGTQSNIEGLIRAEGNANLFLMNPNGIVFGPGAELNIGGSFVATTANAIQFPGGGEFSVNSTVDSGNSLLAINPSAFFFNQIANQQTPSIEVRNAELTVGSPNNPRSLLLVGGNVLIDGGNLPGNIGNLQGVEGSDIQVGSFIGTGSVELSVGTDNQLRLELPLSGLPTGLVGGNISFTNGAVVNTGSTANNAGNILIAGGTLSLTGASQVSTSTFGAGDAGSVTLRGDRIFMDGSAIFSRAVDGSNGNAGGIFIEAGSFFLNSSRLDTNSDGSGLAGDIVISVSDQLSVLNQSEIASEGDFGRIFIGENDVYDASVSPRLVIIDSFSKLSTTNNLSSGRTGRISIRGREQVSVTNGSEIISESNSDSTSEFGLIEISATEGSVILNESTKISTTNSNSGFAGDILISARDEISILNSEIASEGNYGRIFIGSNNLKDDASSAAIVRIDNASKLSTTNNLSTGRAGEIRIRGRDQVSIADESQLLSQSNNDNTAASEFGFIDIAATQGSVFLNNSTISTTNFGSGWSGDVSISASEGVFLNQSGIFSRGNSGRIFIGESDDYVSFSPRIIKIDNSEVNTRNDSVSKNFGGDINVGNISIQANESVLLTNNTRVRSSTSRPGDAGSIAIEAGSISLNNTMLETETSTTGDAGFVFLQTNGGAVSLDNSRIFSTVESGGVGEGGYIQIETGTLSLTNESGLQTLVREATTLDDGTVLPAGVGNAGLIDVRATDFVTLDNSGMFSDVRAGTQGNAGSISIEAESVALNNNSSLETQTSGTGDAGFVFLQTNGGAVSLDNSKIFSTVESGGVGEGGYIQIETGTLSLTNESGLQTLVREATTLDNGTVVPAGVGNAGLIDVRATDSVTLDNSGIFSTVKENAVGTAGRVQISTETLSVENNSRVAVDNFSRDDRLPAGDIDITARDIFMLNDGEISATTLSGRGGNINLNVEDLLVLLGNSNISTTAGLDPGGGDGGNINIQARFILGIPVNDNNITAEAYTGNGGRINIKASRLFSIARRSANFPNTNDITTRSQFGLDGVIDVNEVDVDPNQGLTNLPQTPADTSRLISPRCTALGKDSDTEVNKFTVTGRGGLPPSPNDTLQGESVGTNWVTTDPPRENYPENNSLTNPDSSVPAATSVPKTPELVEAQGWVYGSHGEVILTAKAPTATPHNPSLIPIASCNSQ